VAGFESLDLPKFVELDAKAVRAIPKEMIGRALVPREWEQLLRKIEAGDQIE